MGQQNPARLEHSRAGLAFPGGLAAGGDSIPCHLELMTSRCV
jgi:hypothetical protein